MFITLTVKPDMTWPLIHCNSNPAFHKERVNINNIVSYGLRAKDASGEEVTAVRCTMGYLKVKETPEEIDALLGHSRFGG